MKGRLNSVYSMFPCGDIILEGELHLPGGYEEEVAQKVAHFFVAGFNLTA